MLRVFMFVLFSVLPTPARSDARGPCSAAKRPVKSPSRGKGAERERTRCRWLARRTHRGWRLSWRRPRRGRWVRRAGRWARLRRRRRGRQARTGPPPPPPGLLPSDVAQPWRERPPRPPPSAALARSRAAGAPRPVARSSPTLRRRRRRTLLNNNHNNNNNNNNSSNSNTNYSSLSNQTN